MTIRTKRQSTTSKITAQLCRLIAAHCANGDGVIVRFKGKEYGVLSVCWEGGSEYSLATIEGELLFASKCTVRKGLPCPSN
jgi:hypothetical protein